MSSTGFTTSTKAPTFSNPLSLLFLNATVCTEHNLIISKKIILLQQVMKRLSDVLAAVQETDMWSAARPSRSCNMDRVSAVFLLLRSSHVQYVHELLLAFVLPAGNNINRCYCCLCIALKKKHTLVSKGKLLFCKLSTIIYNCYSLNIIDSLDFFLYM